MRHSDKSSLLKHIRPIAAAAAVAIRSRVDTADLHANNAPEQRQDEPTTG